MCLFPISIGRGQRNELYRWEELGRVIVDDGKRNGYEGFPEHDHASGGRRPGEATFVS